MTREIRTTSYSRKFADDNVGNLGLRVAQYLEKELSTGDKADVRYRHRMPNTRDAFWEATVKVIAEVIVLGGHNEPS